MSHYEKTLSTDEKFKGKVFRITQDQVELENGKTATREVVHHGGGTCIVALDEADNVYLVRQYRYPLQRETVELPAGKLEPGEDPLLAAKRELLEECGLSAEQFIGLGTYYPSPGFCGEIIWLWGAKALVKKGARPDEDEFLTTFSMPLKELTEKCLSGEIRDGKTVAGVLRMAFANHRGIF